ncbi:Transcription elongation factor B polypeptide 3 [Fasciola hepatica]|uniref:Transcription elongation factor B polypeptide 3 n=1 Tax=Fasciola hepatica TaxID=6192 RepID=A0A4E0R9U5_FASHE|nr:Transcription elongation factor B polypeptide 3 [Fasciola hepatica]
MADGLVPALIKFGETPSDRSVEASQKLRVLNALNDVKLTLTELSESGLGKKVSQLKNEPGDLGTTARSLVSKWKTLLKDYLRWESTHLAQGVKSIGPTGNDQVPLKQNEELNTDSTRNHSLTNGYEKSRTSDRTCHDVSHVQSSSSLVRRPTKTTTTSSPSENTSMSDSLEASSSAATTISSPSSPFITNIATKNNNPVTASTSSSLNYASTPGSDHNYDPVISAHGTKKSKRKRKLVDDGAGSIDASSGLSFMESLCAGSTSNPVRKKRSKPNKTASSPKDQPLIPIHIPARNPVRPSASFTAEVLSSLEDDVDRPDVVNHSLSTTRTGSGKFDDDDDDDGNLKFKSKKILWVPKPSRTVLPRTVGISGVSGAAEGSSPNSQVTTPPSLIDLCLAVIERNLSRVDHVGQVPYELFGRALRHSTPVELAHIEQCNPQFVGCSDDLWQRHVQREFQHAKEHNPRSDETWCEFYTRLASDEEKRLDRIINRSARKIKEELQARRVTRSIEAIPPRQVQKRARQCGHNPIASTSNTNNKSTIGYRPFGEPTNVSRPGPNSLTPRSSSLGANEKAGVVVTSGANSNTSKPNGGGLLNKLRKQFQLGRLR